MLIGTASATSLVTFIWKEWSSHVYESCDDGYNIAENGKVYAKPMFRPSLTTTRTPLKTPRTGPTSSDWVWRLDLDDETLDAHVEERMQQRFVAARYVRELECVLMDGASTLAHQRVETKGEGVNGKSSKGKAKVADPIP